MLGLVGGAAAVVLAIGAAAAARHGAIALNPTFRPEVDDGLVRSVRLSGVHSIEDLAAAMKVAYGRPVQVHWAQLGLAEGRGLEFEVPEVDVANAFRLVNAQLLQTGPSLSWRTFATHVEIGEGSYFDKMEVERREYDVTGTVRAWRAAATEEIPSPDSQTVLRKAMDLVETVRPETWLDKGGEVASIEITGATLIVTAPRGMHPEIARVLETYERSAHRAVISNPKPVRDSSWGGRGGSPMCFGPGSAWDRGVRP
jgi:hypothetical protein